ncbi:MAG: PfkB family carbohydrate kinase [Alphaproteobacteria bacterium]
MTTIRFAVIGNPVVDALAPMDAAFVTAHNLKAGDANMVTPESMIQISAQANVQKFQSGGAGANVAYTLAKLGYSTCFAGPIGTDPAGRHFFKDLLAAGLTTVTPHDTYRTTELFVLVTPDGTRTMVQPIPPVPHQHDDWVDEAVIRPATWLVVEGYIARDWPAATVACLNIAREQSMAVALLLPAPHVCAATADALGHVLEHGVTLIVGNTHEFKALETHLPIPLRATLARTARVVTNSSQGAMYVAADGTTFTELSRNVDVPVDNTGAGDAFAAGFLAAFAEGASPSLALRRGHLLGGAVIQTLGPRLPDPKAVWMTADTHVNVGI